MTVELSAGIRLMSGALFDYNDPDASRVTIDDIAHATSNVCRFAGHVSYFYSVAQHAVNTSLIVSQKHAFTALMHDTAEAFTNDIPTPLKVAVPMFKELEVRIETAMAKKFKFAYPLPEEVKLADLQMLGLEKEVVKGDFTDWDILKGVEYRHLADKVYLKPMTPENARMHFRLRYDQLAPAWAG